MEWSSAINTTLKHRTQEHFLNGVLADTECFFWFDVLISASSSFHSLISNQMVEGKAMDWMQLLKRSVHALEMQRNLALCLVQPSQKNNKNESRRTGSWPWNVGRQSCSATASPSTMVSNSDFHVTVKVSSLSRSYNWPAQCKQESLLL